MNSGEFRMFDFGALKNKRRYGKTTPPSYELGEISAPIYLYYGDNDWMAAVSDVQRLAGKLKNLKGNHRVPVKKFNHLDFIYGTNTDSLIYAKVIAIIRENHLA
jgi:lysosomal acid lipase/cholesteryl ester hydrolase